MLTANILVFRSRWDSCQFRHQLTLSLMLASWLRVHTVGLLDSLHRLLHPVGLNIPVLSTALSCRPEYMKRALLKYTVCPNIILCIKPEIHLLHLFQPNVQAFEQCRSELSECLLSPLKDTGISSSESTGHRGASDQSGEPTNYKAALGHAGVSLGSHGLHLEAARRRLFAWTALAAATAWLGTSFLMS